jgi:hypothetical protein
MKKFLNSDKARSWEGFFVGSVVPDSEVIVVGFRRLAEKQQNLIIIREGPGAVGANRASARSVE